MKKISTVLIANLLLLIISATARPSRLILDNRSGYQVSVNNRIYNKDNDNMRIVNLSPGTYTLQLYNSHVPPVPHLFCKSHLVQTKTITLVQEDVEVSVLPDGRIHVSPQAKRVGRVTTRRPRTSRYYDDDENNDWNQDRKEDHDKNGSQHFDATPLWSNKTYVFQQGNVKELL